MIKLTNHNTDPSCLKNPAYTWQVTASRDDAGKVVCTGRHPSSYGVPCGAVRTWLGSLAGLDGYILCSITSGMSAENAARAFHQYATTIERLTLPDGWSAVVSRIPQNAGNLELWIYGDQPVTLQCSGIYSPADWEQVRQLWQQGCLTIPWFDGDSKPK